MNNNHEDSMWGINDEDWRSNASVEPDIVIGELVVSEYDIMLAVEKLGKYLERGPTELEIENFILMAYG